MNLSNLKQIDDTLANGLKVVVTPLPHLHTVSLGLFVKTGSRFETKQTQGISHFLEHMIFRGNAVHPSTQELYLAFEQLGGTLGAATHADFTLYQVNLPADNLEPGLKALSSLVQQPTFQNIDIEKQIVREEILGDLDENGREIDIDNVARKLIFGEHPLGFKIPGHLHNIDDFDNAMLQAHLEQYYVGSNMVLAVGGAVQPAQVVSIAKTHFASIASGSPASYLPYANQTQATPAGSRSGHGRWKYVTHDGSQTDVRVSMHCPGQRDPEYPALHLLTRLLDDGMSTRLYKRICDERGLAYDVFANVEPFDECGVFDVGISVEHHKTPEALLEIEQILSKLRTDLVPRDELEKAQQRHVWDLQATLDDADEVTAIYGAHALFDLPITLQDMADQVERVRPEQIRELAGQVFHPSNMHVACVGMLDESTQFALDHAREQLETRWRFQEN